MPQRPGKTGPERRRLKPADFDEQLWPVNCAIIVLAGSLAGLIVARGKFDPAQTGLLDNGYVQLGLVGLLIGVLIWAVTWLQAKMARRVQLCVLFSLLVHLGLAVYLHGQYLALLAEREARQAREAAQPRELLTVPDYLSDHPERPRTAQSFERPVETEVPSELRLEPVPMQPAEPETPIDRPKAVEPESPQPEPPNPAEIDRAQLSAPQRAEAAGAQISRQEWEQRPLPDEPVPLPEIRPAGREAPSPLRPQVAAVQRRQVRAPAHQRQTFEPPPSALEPRQAPELTRLATGPGSLPELVATPSPTRELIRPADAPYTEARAPEPVRAAEPTQFAPLEPGPIAARRGLDVPGLVRRSPQATPARPQAVTGAATPQRGLDPRPEVAEAPRAIPWRQPRLRPATIAAAVGEPQPPVVAAARPEPIPLRPADVPVGRRTTPVARLPGRVSAQEAGGGPPLPTLGTGGPSAAVAGRAATSAEQPTGTTTFTAGPRRSTRAGYSISLPSTTVAAEGVAAPAVPGAAAPGGLQLASAGTALRRATDAVLKRPNNLPVGPAGLRSGTSPTAAQIGRAPTASTGVPSTGLGTSGERISRMTAQGTLAWTDLPTGIPEAVEAALTGGQDAAGGEGSPSGPLQPSGDPQAAVARSAVDGLATLRGSGERGPATGPAGGRVATARIGQAARAEMLSVGPPASGVAGLSRRTGRTPAADLVAEAGPEPGALTSGAGTADEAAGPALRAGSGGGQPRMTGLPGSFAQRVPVESALVSGPTATTLGITSGPRRLPLGADQGLPLAARFGGGPLGKTSTPGLLRGLADISEQQPIPAAEAAGPGDLDVMAGAGIGGPSRHEGGLPVQIAAALGPGGLSVRPSPSVGIPGPRARPESDVVHAAYQRFLVKRSGGRLAVDGRVREVPTEAFRHRDPGRRAEMLKQYQGTEGSERAVQLGIEFLVRHQFPDGHWSLDQFPQGDAAEYADAGPAQIRADTAATGLALLAFLGAGYTHMDGKYRTVVGRGIDWLLANQQPNGQLFTIPTDPERAGRIYGHGIGAIALCEAYGMTKDPGLREPAQRAIQFIVDAQHPTWGGWRYTKRDDAARWRKESDTSVSGWQLMALKSAQMAGLEVPSAVMQKAGHWLDLAQAQGGTRYVYNPYAGNTPEQRLGRVPNLAMTAEGLLMRLYLGWDRDHPGMIGGANHLKENLPDVGTADRPLRDVYYWYYATQVMFQMQGEHWTAWNDRLRPLLVKSQVESGPLAGSWDAYRPVRDRWAHAGGRLYVTALNLLMLEVYYRHLPLFQTLVSDTVVRSE